MSVTRKTYTEEEAYKYMESRATAGRKGLKLPRINLAFTPELYKYIRVMSKIRGESMTEFVNAIVADSMKNNAETYEKAKEFASMFDSSLNGSDPQEEDEDIPYYYEAEADEDEEDEDDEPKYYF